MLGRSEKIRAFYASTALQQGREKDDCQELHAFLRVRITRKFMN